jgi:hypothetical protein
MAPAFGLQLVDTLGDVKRQLTIDVAFDSSRSD